MPTIEQHINASASLSQRIQRIDEIINCLYDLMAKQAVESGHKEYTLDTGQTKISAVYYSIDEIQRQVLSLERLREMYSQRISGRVTRLMDYRNIRR